MILRSGVLREVVYVSIPTRPLGDGDLSALLTRAREKNERLVITGMLLLVAGNFIQLLEGPAEVLDPTVEAIRHDARHTDMTILVQREIERRRFLDWSMGYRRLDAGDPKLKGYSDLPSRPADFALSEKAKSLAVKLLHGFQTSHR
ncbi:MAG: BLUF domain-containing protein [Alphaproteobacteria bacterium]|nr:BLUF domain-containing protein [Alphaproteobacteria bacterium]